MWQIRYILVRLAQARELRKFESFSFTTLNFDICNFLGAWYL